MVKGLDVYTSACYTNQRRDLFLQLFDFENRASVFTRILVPCANA